MKSQHSQMFVLRTWQEGTGHLWRASVLNVATNERQYFKNPRQLSKFLAELSTNKQK